MSLHEVSDDKDGDGADERNALIQREIERYPSDLRKLFGEDDEEENERKNTDAISRTTAEYAITELRDMMSRTEDYEALMKDTTKEIECYRTEFAESAHEEIDRVCRMFENKIECDRRRDEEFRRSESNHVRVLERQRDQEMEALKSSLATMKRERNEARERSRKHRASELKLAQSEALSKAKWSWEVSELREKYDELSRSESDQMRTMKNQNLHEMMTLRETLREELDSERKRNKGTAASTMSSTAISEDAWKRMREESQELRRELNVSKEDAETSMILERTECEIARVAQEMSERRLRCMEEYADEVEAIRDEYTRQHDVQHNEIATLRSTLRTMKAKYHNNREQLERAVGEMRVALKRSRELHEKERTSMNGRILGLEKKMSEMRKTTAVRVRRVNEAAMRIADANRFARREISKRIHYQGVARVERDRSRALNRKVSVSPGGLRRFS